MLAAVGVCHELFAPVFDPAHRPSQFPRKPAEADFLGQQDALVAEATADVGRDHTDRSLVQAQALRQSRAVDVRHLRGAVHLELVEPRVPFAQNAAPLHRRHRLARGADMAADLDRRVLLRLREVRVDQGFQKDVVAPVVVHQRGRFGARFDHVDDGRQLLVVGVDLRGDVLGFGAGGRDAHRDRLAHQAHLVLRERPEVRGLESRERGHGADRLDAVEVLHREYAVLESGGLLDAEDASMRDRRAHERHLQHARALDVADELAAAAQVAVVFLAAERRANALGARARGFPGH